MWSDNEAEVDLLGFEYLVDSLVAVLGESHLLPLTVGVNGDWGSGKSSLIRMAANRLKKEDSGYLVIEFSPWVHEDYQDVKTSLIATILHEITRTAPDSGRGHIDRLWGMLMTLARRSRMSAAPLIAAGASAVGAPPEVAQATAGAVMSVVAASEDVPKSTYSPAVSDLLAPREFRSLFSELIATQEHTVVVLIDDLDRCLPDTVVDTLEAIRLFVSVPNTAYVIAAHRQMVEAAIDRRYPASERDEGSVGRGYLEKMLQVIINVPPLSEPEAETYLTLLLCELHLNPNQFERVVAAAASQYREVQLIIAMNEGGVTDVLGGLAPALAADLRWVTAIAPAIAGGLRGNPRQLKRFLNTLRLRAKTSEIRGVSLDHATLAKLMVLEEIDASAFETLFRWQMEHSGKPPELAVAEGGAIVTDYVAESTADSPEGTEIDLREDVIAWSSRTAVARWLTLEPPLAHSDLRPYFYLVRDRFAPGGLSARLPAALQQLVGQLSVASNPRRRSAVEQALSFGPEELEQLSLALADRARRSPRDPATYSLIEMAATNESLQAILAKTLAAMSLSSVPPSIPPILLTRFNSGPPAEIVAVLDSWGEQEIAPSLAAAVRSARQVSSS